jgi:hypothetical protein
MRFSGDPAVATRFLISVLVAGPVCVEILLALLAEEEICERAESREELRGMLRPEGALSLFMEDDVDIGDSGGDWPICPRYESLPTREIGFVMST